MALAQLTERNGKHELYNEEFSLYSQRKLAEHSASYLTPRSLDILRLLSEGGVRKTVQVYEANQTDLASKLRISRQALNLQLRRLKERKLIQIGGGVHWLNRRRAEGSGLQHNSYDCDNTNRTSEAGRGSREDQDNPCDPNLQGHWTSGCRAHFGATGAESCVGSDIFHRWCS